MDNVAESQPKDNRRLFEIDVLRGLAAIAVLACHYISECQRIGRIDFDFHYGAYGPHLFFIVSGFVISLTLNRSKSPLEFAYSRFSRLYPVYWVGIAVSVLVALTPHFPDPFPTVKEYIGNLSMCQSWLGLRDIEDSYWTLAIELKFYFLVFLLLALRLKHRIEMLLVLWLSAVVLIRCLSLTFEIPGVLRVPFILDYAHLFAAGIAFYRLRSFGSSWLRHSIIGIAVPLAYWAEGVEGAVMTTGFLTVFYLFNADKLRWINWFPLRFLGEISYPLYLVHGSIGIAIIWNLDQFDAPLWSLFALPSAVVIGLAAVIAVYFERPANAAFRAWYANSKRCRKELRQFDELRSLRLPL